MNWSIFIPSILAAIITVGSWFVLHMLSKQRDQYNKRKELRIQYLIDAWRKLEFAAQRPDIDVKEYLEQPIADIQLFGSAKQIELVRRVGQDMSTKHLANLSELLTELRNDLRRELDLEVITSDIMFLRIPNKNTK